VIIPLALAGTLPLALRRVAPLAVVAVLMVVAVTGTFIARDFKPFELFIAWLIVVYTVAAHEESDNALRGLVVAVLAMATIGLNDGFGARSDGITVEIFVFASWGLGRAIRRRETAADELREHAQQLEARREEQEQEALAGERTRIARELHDVVAHGVSVMVVQAQGAQRVLQREPSRATEALRSIESSGREALVELRRLLGVLRPDFEEDATSPQPGLDELGSLVDGVRNGGLAVDLEVEGTACPLPPGLALAAYRIIQEALTNVVKHAQASRAHVAVRYLPNFIELEVSDNGRGTRLNNNRGLGHGLIGMRERTNLYGGTLQAGPSDSAGYSVLARLPLSRESP
jgi:signal transduction histidine kinase